MGSHLQLVFILRRLVKRDFPLNCFQCMFIPKTLTHSIYNINSKTWACNMHLNVRRYTTCWRKYHMNFIYVMYIKDILYNTLISKFVRSNNGTIKHDCQLSSQPSIFWSTSLKIPHPWRQLEHTLSLNLCHFETFCIDNEYYLELLFSRYI